MSIFLREFETQKDTLKQKQIQQITEGINRQRFTQTNIRFIKNKINNKANFVSRLLNTQRYIAKTFQPDQKKFITSSTTLNSTRRPLSELRSLDQSRLAFSIKQQKLQQASKIKEKRKQHQEVIKQAKNKIHIENVYRMKKVKRNEQNAKNKISQFHENKIREIKTSKEQMSAGIERDLESKQDYLQNLQKRVMLGEKFKDIILSKMQLSAFQSLKSGQSENN